MRDSGEEQEQEDFQMEDEEGRQANLFYGMDIGLYE